MRVVLDTNVYLAAFLKKSLASEILSLGQRRKVDLFISPLIKAEIKKKLKEKFLLDQEIIGEFMDLIEESTILVKPTKKIKIIKVDPADNIILECASKSQADLIISMDKHLLRLKVFQNSGIVHPKTLTWILPQLFRPKN